MLYQDPLSNADNEYHRYWRCYNRKCRKNWNGNGFKSRDVLSLSLENQQLGLNRYKLHSDILRDGTLTSKEGINISKRLFSHARVDCERK